MNLDKIQQIIEGYRFLISKDPRVEKIALDRAAICSDCEELSTALNFYLYCKKCGCYMPSKMRSPSSECIIGKWKAQDIETTITDI